jgi:hypothetical protein
MERTGHPDFDRVMATLRWLMAETTDPAERVAIGSDIAELDALAEFWAARIAAGTARGNAHNLAVLGWTGADTKRRLPFVLRALGLGG